MQCCSEGLLSRDLGTVMSIRRSIACGMLAFLVGNPAGEAAAPSPSRQQTECDQLRDRLVREASRGGGRGLERYCDDCGRGGGPGYRVVQLPGRGVAGKFADEIREMSCDELQELEVKRQEIAAGIQAAHQIDRQRQLDEQRYRMTGRRDWDRETFEDPESDYWHTQGYDPRIPGLEEQVEDFFTAIRASFGIGRNGVPLTLPSTGTLPGVTPHPARAALYSIKRIVSALGSIGSAAGEVRMARHRRYHDALQRAETDLAARNAALSSQLSRLEQVASYANDRPGSAVVERAIQDLRQRRAIVSERLRAISGSRELVERRLRHYNQRSPDSVHGDRGT